MDLFASLSSLQQALDFHLDRHNVLVANVAHVDTPGYVPRDVRRAPPSSFSAVLDATLARTSPQHLALPESDHPRVGEVFEDPSAGVGNDLNGVSLDREAAKVAANQVRYDVVAQIATSELAGLAYAVSDGRNGL